MSCAEHQDQKHAITYRLYNVRVLNCSGDVQTTHEGNPFVLRAQILRAAKYGGLDFAISDTQRSTEGRLPEPECGGAKKVVEVRRNQYGHNLVSEPGEFNRKDSTDYVDRKQREKVALKAQLQFKLGFTLKTREIMQPNLRGQLLKWRKYSWVRKGAGTVQKAGAHGWMADGGEASVDGGKAKYRIAGPEKSPVGPAGRENVHCRQGMAGSMVFAICPRGYDHQFLSISYSYGSSAAVYKVHAALTA
ncbi:hypothetical protein C8R43DRAFT_946598 [Mycena crocata]|nr:hypothetical protein C8R43DRAFT_946598 [Mycena crocata]